MAAMPMNKEFDKRVDDFFRNYHDRGMVKWAGFYLSDHVLKMHKKSKADAYVEIKKAEMSPEEVSKVLLKAFGESRIVSVQMRILNKEGELFRSFQGHVLGVDEDNVMIADHIVEIEEINYIEIIDKKTP